MRHRILPKLKRKAAFETEQRVLFTQKGAYQKATCVKFVTQKLNLIMQQYNEKVETKLFFLVDRQLKR